MLSQTHGLRLPFLVCGLAAVGVWLISCDSSSNDTEPVDATLACSGMSWEPSRCRCASPEDPVLPPRNAWSNLHGDMTNSDETSVAVAPAFEASWTTESDTFNVTGPTLDSAGNVYLTPLFPIEGVVLISLDPDDGSRRWAIRGDDPTPGGSAAMILRDPDGPGRELVYVGFYERVIAVTTDGELVWDRPTGLAAYELPPANLAPATFGANYVPQVDAIVGLTQDGLVYAHDRVSGEPILSEPYALPGSPSPAAEASLPEAVLDQVRDDMRDLVDVPGGGDPANLLAVLLGNETEVANFFSVDPNTGNLWIAATAPDAEDGTEDGVSELGALYQLHLAAGADHAVVTEVCHASFDGGSASTPAVRLDGERVYVGDNVGNLIAVSPDCSVAWELGVGDQIVGSIAVASDNQEVYASTAVAAVKVVDRGPRGEIVWNTQIDAFDPGEGETNLNLNLLTIAANGLALQAGVGVLFNGIALPRETGIGVLDRETGELRSFAVGLDETVSVIPIGPRGDVFIGNSPLRRIIQRAGAGLLGVEPGPAPVGGVTKFARKNLDSLLLDISCAGRARAKNAESNAQSDECPLSVSADATQLAELIEQARGAGPEAVAEGSLSDTTWAMVAAAFDEAASAVEAGSFSDAAAAFSRAAVGIDAGMQQ